MKRQDVFNNRVLKNHSIEPNDGGDGEDGSSAGEDDEEDVEGDG